MTTLHWHRDAFGAYADSTVDPDFRFYVRRARGHLYSLTVFMSDNDGAGLFSGLALVTCDSEESASSARTLAEAFESTDPTEGPHTRMALALALLDTEGVAA